MKKTLLLLLLLVFAFNLPQLSCYNDKPRLNGTLTTISVEAKSFGGSSGGFSSSRSSSSSSFSGSRGTSSFGGTSGGTSRSGSSSYSGGGTSSFGGSKGSSSGSFGGSSGGLKGSSSSPSSSPGTSPPSQFGGSKGGEKGSTSGFVAKPLPPDAPKPWRKDYVAPAPPVVYNYYGWGGYYTPWWHYMLFWNLWMSHPVPAGAPALTPAPQRESGGGCSCSRKKEVPKPEAKKETLGGTTVIMDAPK